LLQARANAEEEEEEEQAAGKVNGIKGIVF
jgi:hypothetical protein